MKALKEKDLNTFYAPKSSITPKITSMPFHSNE